MRHHGKLLFLVCSFSIIVTFLLTEIVLTLFFPYNIATIGHVHSKNANTYGWGFDPHETILIGNSDTGETYAAPANNHGWRDKDRTYANHEKAYRILVLGDSTTFGAIVPAEKVYTRILENKLRKAGFNAEIINIAYGGWGTDQQLEALKIEGLKYHPDLVIIQFCTNDLSDNTYFVSSDEKNKNLKPFYYTIDNDDNLVRNNNPYFRKGKIKSFREFLRFIIRKSQILKRAYSLAIRYYVKENDNMGQKKYWISDNQLAQLKLSLNLSHESGIMQLFKKRNNSKITTNEIELAIKRYKHDKNRENILKILEKRWFHQYWSKENYFPKEQKVTALAWRLYFKLILEAKAVIKKYDSTLAVFSDNEIGHYDWDVSWFRVSSDDISKAIYLQHTEIIKKFANENQIDFIENTIPHHRARNDPHPNIEGNEAMAENIYQYLMNNKLSELVSYRKR